MESPETRLSRIASAIQDALGTETPVAEHIRVGRSRFVQHVLSAERGAVHVLGTRHALVAAAVALAATVAVFVGSRWMERPISFEIGARAAAGHLGDVVEALETRALPLTFSDGSSIVLQGGGRARVLTADANGAHVLLEAGQAEVSITHRDHGTHWDFEAGPFRVLVTGTQFLLAWNPAQQALALSMKQGSVVVSGGCLTKPQVLRAGAQLRLSCSPTAASAPSEATSAEPTASARVAPTGSAALQGAKQRGASDGPRVPGASDATTELGWRELLRTGRVSDALRAAEQGDFHAICAQATRRELLDLADGARLSGRAGFATEALLALRRRFAGSADAATAAFALGRLAFEQRRSYADAARWFKTYGEEAPNGPLMGDAAGRLMEARVRQGDRAGARVEAERYLARFPEGPYAAEARGILNE